MLFKKDDAEINASACREGVVSWMTEESPCLCSETTHTFYVASEQVK